MIVDGAAIGATASSSASAFDAAQVKTGACWDTPQQWRGMDQTMDPERLFWSCSTYKVNEFCTSSPGGSAYGTGWDDSWGTFSDLPDANGVDASMACCACGGGRNITGVESSHAWTKAAGKIGDLAHVSWEDWLGCRFFTGVVVVAAAFAGSNNVGTRDPLGWHSVYSWHSGLSLWKTPLCSMYAASLSTLVPVATYYMLLASSGVSIVFNSLAIMYLLDVDEQLLSVLLPMGVRADIRREFRDARDAMGYRHGWDKWKRLLAAGLGEIGAFLCFFAGGSYLLHQWVVNGGY